MNEVNDVFDLLSGSGVRFLDYRNDTVGLLDCIVSKLIQGEVIGWVCGRMELALAPLVADLFSPIRDGLK